MKTHFAFGKNGIDVEVPDGFDCQVVRSRAARALDDVAGALEAALDHPIYSDPPSGEPMTAPMGMPVPASALTAMEVQTGLTRTQAKR